MVCGGTVPGVPLASICSVLTQIAPLRLAEEWDNVGLLIGDRRLEVARVMTCLTITPDVVDEAVRSHVGLIVSHHPLPFQPVGKITSDTITSEMLLHLIGNQIAVYSAHTAFDSAANGVNQQWAEILGLESIEPLIPLETIRGSAADSPSRDGTANSPRREGSANSPRREGTANSPHREGSGRLGILPQARPAVEIIAEAARSSKAHLPRIVRGSSDDVRKVAIACGSGGSFLSAAKRRGVELLITGEATFHTCLEARSMGISLGLLGHFASERFAMDQLAKHLANEIDGIEVWASKSEYDPIEQVVLE